MPLIFHELIHVLASQNKCGGKHNSLYSEGLAEYMTMIAFPKNYFNSYQTRTVVLAALGTDFVTELFLNENDFLINPEFAEEEFLNSAIAQFIEKWNIHPNDEAELYEIFYEQNSYLDVNWEARALVRLKGVLDRNNIDWELFVNEIAPSGYEQVRFEWLNIF